jgi:hypothetical protein
VQFIVMPKLNERRKSGWRSVRERAAATMHIRRPLNPKRLAAKYRKLAVSFAQNVNAIYNETARLTNLRQLATEDSAQGRPKEQGTTKFSFRISLSEERAAKVLNYMHSRSAMLNRQSRRISDLEGILSSEAKISTGERRKEIEQTITELQAFRKKTFGKTEHKTNVFNFIMRAFREPLEKKAERSSKPVVFEVELPERLKGQ